MRRPSGKVLIALLLFTGVVGGGIWYFTRGGNTTQDYLTTAVARGDVEDNVTAYGMIQPSEYVDIGTQVSGILKELYVDIGSTVAAGDHLADIDDTVYRAKVAASSAAVANLQAQLEQKQAALSLADLQNKRSKELLTQHVVSEDVAQTNEAAYVSAIAQVHAIEAQISQAEASLKTDEANLTYTNISAPAAGTVITLIARKGQTLNANQMAPVILRLANLAKMTVWAQVSEADVPKLKPGIPAYFNTLGQLTQRWCGNIRAIYPTPETISGAIFYNVLFDVENPRNDLLPQMTAQVFFVLAEAKNVLIVPVVALAKPKSDKKSEYSQKCLTAQSKGDAEAYTKQYTVQVLKGDQVEVRQVTVGVMGRISAEVTSGLEEGELVIVGRKTASDSAAPAGMSGMPGGVRLR